MRCNSLIPFVVRRQNMKKTDHLPTFRKKKSRKKLMRGMLLFSPVLALFCLVTAVYIASYYDKSLQNEEQETNGVAIQAGRQDGIGEELGEDPQGQDYLQMELNPVQEQQLVQKDPQSGQHNLDPLQENAQDILAVDDNTDIYITPRMTYTLEIYDACSGELTSETQPIPNDMYGLNRMELEDYLVQLASMENAENQEIESHYQVTVFSRRAFTVRKTITEKKLEYAIFLIAENGWLTAYTGDRAAVYEELHIALGDFPLEQQAMLTQGIYMKTLTDYYDFLETYSS